MEDIFHVECSRKEIVALFLSLKKHVQEHDPVQTRLMGKIERMLYEVMTIEEMETLEAVYKRL